LHFTEESLLHSFSVRILWATEL